MRDVLAVVTVIGGLGILFVLALAATKYGEALEKERRAEPGARDRGEDPSESSKAPARPWGQLES